MDDTVAYAWAVPEGTATNVNLGDDDGETVPIGFTFSFYGNDRTTVGLTSNGYLTFGSDYFDWSVDPTLPN